VPGPDLEARDLAVHENNNLPVVIVFIVVPANWRNVQDVEMTERTGGRTQKNRSFRRVKTAEPMATRDGGTAMRARRKRFACGWIVG
jgi:hypothetical protein